VSLTAFLSALPRPKQDCEDDRPHNAPADPGDVWVSRLPFEDFLWMGMSAISVLHDNLLIVHCYFTPGGFAWIVAGVPTTAYCAPVAGGRLTRAALTKSISEGADESMSIALRRSMLVLVWYGLRHHGRRQQRGDADRRYDHFQVRSHVRDGILLPRSATLTATKPSTAARSTRPTRGVT
jgi:hypothetical protein